MIFLINKEKGIFIWHLHNWVIKIIIYVNLDQRLINCKIINTDTWRSFHIDISTGHKRKTIRHHDSIKRVENGILGFFNIKLKNGFLVSFEIPNEERWFLNTYRILAIKKFVIQNVFHGRWFNDKLSSIDLFLCNKVLFLDIIYSNLLQKDFKIIFVIISVTKNSNILLPKANKLLDVDQVTLK